MTSTEQTGSRGENLNVLLTVFGGWLIMTHFIVIHIRDSLRLCEREVVGKTYRFPYFILLLIE